MTYLGIEIGGTKLQLGLNDGLGSPFAELVRHDINPDRGANGILEQIDRAAHGLLAKHTIARIGIAFGGPVDRAAGVTIKSHQIDGWENVPLVRWCQQSLGVDARLVNDCDAAALAEARFGAGKGKSSVFYVTVGTGVGGGFVVDGELFGQQRPAVAEIGHLRPGLHDDRPDATVESLASGWGVVSVAQARLSGQVSRSFERVRYQNDRPTTLRRRLATAEKVDEAFAADLLERAGGSPEDLTAKILAQAAAEGNNLAAEVMQHGIQALGWAIAQVVTLLAPEIIVVGGGVSLMGENCFFMPLREQVQRYVFPPLARSFDVVPAQLGEAVVVHGATAVAACP